MQKDLDKFKGFLIRHGLENRTIQQHLIRIKVLQRELDELTFENTDAYLIKRLSEGAAGSTVNKFVQTIKKWCEFTEQDWGNKVKKIREKNKTKILLSDEEIDAFIKLNPPPSKMGMLWMCVAYTGARISEILNLTVNDIDNANKLLLFHDTKTGEGRNVPITEILFNDLQEYVKTIPHGYLFYRKMNQNAKPEYDKQMNYASALIDFKKRKSELHITKAATPYSLRHSFINRLLTDAQAPLFVVQDIVGHRSANTTRRYYHGSIKAMHAAIQQDPLMRKHINPQILLSQLLKYIREFLQKDARFGCEIFEKEGEVSIKIKIKRDEKQ
jgi:integrase